jgi:hypothetical protein
MSDQVRAWPGGTGGFKLGLNYAPGFVAQRTAAALGYQQLLWLLGETIAEAGAMNVFAVFERPDGGELALVLLLRVCLADLVTAGWLMSTSCSLQRSMW